MAEPLNLRDADDETLARAFRRADELAKTAEDPAVRDKAFADAKVMAQEINRRRQGAAEEAPMRIGAGDGDTGAFGQYLSGVNEGLVTNTVGGILDLPNAAINLGIKGLNKFTGTDIQELPYASDTLQSALEYDLPDIPLPFTDATIAMGPMVARPPEGKLERTARAAGQFTGTAAGGTAALMAAPATGLSMGRYVDDIARETTRHVAASPGKAALSEVLAGGTAVMAGSGGGDVGERVGAKLGFPETGRAVGQTVGEIVGGVGGAVVPYTFGNVGRALLADPKSPERYAAAVRQGVEPSTGLVGSQIAAYMENTASLNPLAANRISDVQERQVAQTAAARDRLTENLRQPSGAPRQTNPYGAGAQIREAAEPALAGLRAELGNLTEQELATLGGPEQAIRIDRIRNEISRLMPTQTREGQALLRDKLASLESIRTTPIDKQLDAQLRKKLKTQQDAQEARRARLAEIAAKQGEGTATPQELREARNLRARMPGYASNISSTKVQIDKNLGVRNDQLNNWRRELGAEIPGKGTVGSAEQRGVYRSVRDTQRDAAQDQGRLGEFGQVTQEKRRIAGSDTALEQGGDVAFFEKLLNVGGQPREPQAVYNFLTNKNAAGRIKRYKENVPPEDFQATMGNLIDILGTPTSQTAAVSKGAQSDFSPKQFLTNWRNLPPEVRGMIFEDAAIERHAKDLTVLAEALAARGTAANPSGTTATAIIARTFGTGATSPALTIATLWGNAALARAFMSEKVARAVADANPEYWEAIKPVLLQRFGAAAQTDSNAAEGLE